MEWPVLKEMFVGKALDNVMQLSFEIHIDELGKNKEILPNHQEPGESGLQTVVLSSQVKWQPLPM